ncbi:MAG: hypothetical protein ACRDH7_14980 [Actinomycetota bacterium]
MADRMESLGSTELDELRSELEDVQRELRAEQARVMRYHVVIQQHLAKGCPSRSLRTLLLDTDLPDRH